MNHEHLTKNLILQKEIRKIASQIFYSFYNDYEINESDEYANLYPKEDNIVNLLPKAEKILHYFGSAEAARTAIHFLCTINPKKSKEIFDEL